MNALASHPYRVPVSAVDAVGFVTDNPRLRTRTWAWPDSFGYLVEEAERFLGYRDLRWTFCGIKYEDRPAPDIYQLRSHHFHVGFRLPLQAARDPSCCYLHMAHEVVHLCLLSEKFGSNANVLEEGLATLFADAQSREALSERGWITTEARYVEARIRAQILLRRYPEAVRQLRAMVDEFSDITPDHIMSVAPGLPREMADVLAARFV